MWAGGRFRVILHTEERLFFVFQARDRVVVQVHVCYLHDFRVYGVNIDAESVVVRRNFNLGRPQILNGLVGAAMTELQFERVGTQGSTEHLVSKANAEHRELGVDQFAHQLSNLFGFGRVARTVGNKDSVRLG